MASNLVVPFNFQPVSVDVKTASYTVPAGKYARVVAQVEGSGTFTIDATTALRGTQNSVLATSVLDYTDHASGGQQLMVDTTGTGGSDGSAFTSSTDQKPIVADFWVPTGTVINGTGTWRATVTIYNNIT